MLKKEVLLMVVGDMCHEVVIVGQEVDEEFFMALEEELAKVNSTFMQKCKEIEQVLDGVSGRNRTPSFAEVRTTDADCYCRFRCLTSIPFLSVIRWQFASPPPQKCRYSQHNVKLLSPSPPFTVSHLGIGRSLGL